MKSGLCKYYQPLRLEKPSNFRLVHRPVAERAEHDASLSPDGSEPGLMIEDLAARYYHSYVEVIGGRRCTSSAFAEASCGQGSANDSEETWLSVPLRSAWVKLSRTQLEQMSSGVPLLTAIARLGRHAANVLTAAIRRPHIVCACAAAALQRT